MNEPSTSTPAVFQAARMPWVAALLTALAAACLDVGYSLQAPLPRLGQAGPLATTLLVTMLLVAAAYLVAWFALLRPLGRRWGADQLMLAVAGGVFWLGSTAVAAFASHLARANAPLEQFVRSWLESILVAGVAISAYVFLARTGEGRTRTIILGLFAALPLGLFSLMLWLWLRAFYGGPAPGAVVALALAGAALAAALLGAPRVTAGVGMAVCGFTAIFAAAAGFPLEPRTVAPPQSLAGPATSHQVRHILLLSIDTLRADALSVYNPETQPTPNIDALAADSVVFTDARSPANWTLPSMTSVLTGLSPWVHGVERMESRVPEQITTLPENLLSAGYYTAAIAHNPYFNPVFGLTQGFLDYDVFPRRHHFDDTLGARLLAFLFRPGPTRGLSTDELTGRARAWLENHRGDDFFLWLHYLDPHGGYVPPARFLPDAMPPPGMGPEFLEPFERVRSGARVFGPVERAWIHQLYLSEVRYVDEAVGRIVETLRETHLYDETLIVLLSDHGEEFWEHGGFEHGHALYDEVLRVPLMIKLPHSARRATVTERVSLEDLTPTILDLAAGTSATAEDARSLARTWSAPAEPVPAVAEGLARTKDAARAERPVAQGVVFSRGALYFEPKETVFLGPYKMIRNRMTGEEEWFDLEADPGERQPLREVAQEVREAVEAALSGHARNSAAARQALGLDDTPAAPLDPQTLEDLRSLGYIQ